MWLWLFFQGKRPNKNSRAQNIWKTLVGDKRAIDIGSSISIFTTRELRRTLVTAGRKLNERKPEDNEFGDYGNNPLHLLGTMTVLLETKGWIVDAKIKVIGGSRSYNVGGDLMSSLGLQLIHKASGRAWYISRRRMLQRCSGQMHPWINGNKNANAWNIKSDPPA